MNRFRLTEVDGADLWKRRRAGESVSILISIRESQLVGTLQLQTEACVIGRPLVAALEVTVACLQQVVAIKRAPMCPSVPLRPRDLCYRSPQGLQAARWPPPVAPAAMCPGRSAVRRKRFP